MNTDSIKNRFAQVFENDYQGYEYFIENVVNLIFTGDDAYEPLPVPEEFLTDEKRQRANESGILSILKVGTVDAEEPVDLYDITLSDRKELQYNRVGIQQFIRSELFSFTNAFMLFHNETPEGKDWRFSYAYKETTQKSMTSAKRYTYLFGKNHRARTASERFAKLAGEDKNTQNLLNAFSVEALSKDFFNEYKNQYNLFCKFISEHKNNPEFFGSKMAYWEDKSLRDYVKKMMGRITFIYFLQRKGWINGDMQYMQNAFQKSPHQDDYLDMFLEPLFFGVLNTKQKDRKTLFEKEGWDLSLLKEWKDVPYLNGGLFERDEHDQPKSKFPAEMFKNLFDFYARYNFTIDENDPDDAEVGVDPEMLGHIFENLLEDNKDKGAFYTPKEIVQYMCRESLIAYLTNCAEENTEHKYPHEQTEASVRTLVQTPEQIVPKMSHRQKEDFGKALREVKICDPAIGSGAFPMGLLNELVRLRISIGAWADKANDIAALKREIIQNNIYGVDIEKGAVDIARLRFWLSIVVDSEQPEALPNFDYKFMQGNSLLECFDGVDLSRMLDNEGNISSNGKKKSKAGKNQLGLEFVSADTKRNLQLKLHDYFNMADHEQKLRQRNSINESVKNYICQLGISSSAEAKLSALDPSANQEFFLWHTWFKDVLDNGGFDIVIGNPPYIKEYENRHAFDGFRETSLYYKDKMDLWYGFACHGIDLLQKHGHLCFIAQNNWTTSSGAEKLRKKVMQDSKILQMLDFFDYMVFAQDGKGPKIQTMIMLFQKNSEDDGYTLDHRNIIDGNRKSEKQDMLALLNKEATTKTKYFAPKVIRSNYIDKLLTFTENDEIFDKIATRKLFLNDDEIAQGIVPNPDVVNSRNIKNISDKSVKVGDGVFVVSKDKFLALPPAEKKYIKPLYEPTQMTRYNLNTNEKSILYITKNNWKNDAPVLKKHLEKYKNIMEQRRENQNGRIDFYHLHWAREEKFFKEGGKILSVRKCAQPVFVYTEKEAYVMMAVNVIQTSRWNMKFLTGVLNSKLVAFWLRNKGKMQGSNYQVDKEPLLNIPLPSATQAQQKPIIDLVDKILAAKKENPQADTSVWEEEIDRLVYKLYGLTKDEIKVVEGK